MIKKPHIHKSRERSGNKVSPENSIRNRIDEWKRFFRKRNLIEIGARSSVENVPSHDIERVLIIRMIGEYVYDLPCKMIYKEDDRSDLFDLKTEDISENDSSKMLRNEAVLKNAESVACRVHKYSLINNHNGTSTLRHLPFSDAFKSLNSVPLAEREAFREQPSLSFRTTIDDPIKCEIKLGNATAFLVGPDIIASARHCFPGNKNDNVTDDQKENSKDSDNKTEHIPMKDFRIIFGFEMLNNSEANLIINDHDIYTPQELLDSGNGTDEGDWVFVKLDRKVKGRGYLEFEKSIKLSEGSPLYMLGYPCGLPLKYTSKANVNKIYENGRFSSNLDAFSGNSGSPVFHAESHKVVGIFCESENHDDFIYLNTAESNRKPKAEKADGVEWSVGVAEISKILDNIV